MTLNLVFIYKNMINLQIYLRSLISFLSRMVLPGLVIIFKLWIIYTFSLRILVALILHQFFNFFPFILFLINIQLSVNLFILSILILLVYRRVHWWNFIYLFIRFKAWTNANFSTIRLFLILTKRNLTFTNKLKHKNYKYIIFF